MKIVNNLPKFIDIDDKATDSASGSFICIDNSSDGYLIDFKAYGRSEQKQYDGRNLIPYPYSDTSTTLNGITWTDNGDGTITANGTATADSPFVMNRKLTVPKGTYIISGSPSVSGCAVQLVESDNWSMASSGGSAKTKRYDDTCVYTYCRLLVKAGTTVNNATFKPMLRLLPNLLSYPYVETTTTKNGITWTDNGDTTITANGTATALSQFFFIQNKDGGLKPNTMYKFIGCPSGGSTSTYSLQATIYGTSSATKIYFDNGDGITFTTPSDYSNCMIKVNIQSGTTVSDLTFNPYLMKVETEEVEYEPYVGGMASPNPKYPQEINSVGDGGTLDVKITGKNLLPYPYKFDAAGNSSNGVTFTYDDEGIININGTATASTYYTINPDNLKLESGTYIFSIDNTHDILGIGADIRSNNYHTFLGQYGFEKNATSFIFEYPKEHVGVNYPRIWIHLDEGEALTDAKVKPMLRRLEVKDDTWEAYKETTTSIPLAEPLRSVGDVKDEIVCQDGVYGILRRIGTKLFDGVNEVCGYVTNVEYTEGVMTQVNLGRTEHWSDCKTPTDSILIMCDKFIPQRISSSNSKLYTCWQSSSALVVVTYLPTDLGITTKDEANAWLKENPITVQYILAEPVFEPFEDQTPFHNIKTYDGVTCITATDDAEMDVVYFTNSIDGKNISSYQKVVNERLNCTPSNDIKLINVDSNLIATKMGNTVQMTFNYYEFSSTTGEIEINIDKEYFPTIYAYATCMGYDKETSKYIPIYLYLTLNAKNTALQLSADKIADDGTLVPFTDGAIAGTITYFIN